MGGNLLLLDEPTNDLDVDTLRALEDALISFAGCAVVVSHDRWFLDRIATHVLAFEGDSEVRFFEGNFSDYEVDRHASRRRSRSAAPHQVPPALAYLSALVPAPPARPACAGPSCRRPCGVGRRASPVRRSSRRSTSRVVLSRPGGSLRCADGSRVRQGPPASELNPTARSSPARGAHHGRAPGIAIDPATARHVRRRLVGRVAVRGGRRPPPSVPWDARRARHGARRARSAARRVDSVPAAGGRDRGRVLGRGLQRLAHSGVACRRPAIVDEWSARHLDRLADLESGWRRARTATRSCTPICAPTTCSMTSEARRVRRLGSCVSGCGMDRRRVLGAERRDAGWARSGIARRQLQYASGSAQRCRRRRDRGLLHPTRTRPAPPGFRRCGVPGRAGSRCWWLQQRTGWRGHSPALRVFAFSQTGWAPGVTATTLSTRNRRRTGRNRFPGGLRRRWMSWAPTVLGAVPSGQDDGRALAPDRLDGELELEARLRLVGRVAVELDAGGASDERALQRHRAVRRVVGSGVAGGGVRARVDLRVGRARCSTVDDESAAARRDNRPQTTAGTGRGQGPSAHGRSLLQCRPPRESDQARRPRPSAGRLAGRSGSRSTSSSGGSRAAAAPAASTPTPRTPGSSCGSTSPARRRSGPASGPGWSRSSGPTVRVVASDERSQTRNRALALERLRAPRRRVARRGTAARDPPDARREAAAARREAPALRHQAGPPVTEGRVSGRNRLDQCGTRRRTRHDRRRSNRAGDRGRGRGRHRDRRRDPHVRAAARRDGHVHASDLAGVADGLRPVRPARAQLRAARPRHGAVRADHDAAVPHGLARLHLRRVRRDLLVGRVGHVGRSVPVERIRALHARIRHARAISARTSSRSSRPRSASGSSPC